MHEVPDPWRTLPYLTLGSCGVLVLSIGTRRGFLMKGDFLRRSGASKRNPGQLPFLVWSDACDSYATF